jgi:hypothetical protein
MFRLRWIDSLFVVSLCSFRSVVVFCFIVIYFLCLFGGEQVEHKRGAPVDALPTPGGERICYAGTQSAARVARLQAGWRAPVFGF